MTITLNGTTGITTDTGYSGDGVTFADGTPSNTLVTNTSGNVGIGTSSPTTTLDVRGAGYFINDTNNHIKLLTDNGAMEISRAAGDAYIDLKNADSEDFDCRIQSSGTAGDLRLLATTTQQFYTNGSERMRIDSSGNIYVGTDTTCNLLSFRSKSLATNGYQKLAGGLIMQWGFLTANATITFPIAFPSACVSLTFGAYGTESGVPRSTSVSASSFVYSSSNFANQDAYWLAIGY